MALDLRFEAAPVLVARVAEAVELGVLLAVESLTLTAEVARVTGTEVTGAAVVVLAQLVVTTTTPVLEATTASVEEVEQDVVVESAEEVQVDDGYATRD